MKHLLPSLLVSVFAVLLFSGCAPQTGAIPTTEEVANRKKVLGVTETKTYCEQHGGHYEDWKNDDGTSSTYCMFPAGYGCDPNDFVAGTCGKESDE